MSRCKLAICRKRRAIRTDHEDLHIASVLRPVGR
jgi:hypothetical protein